MSCIIVLGCFRSGTSAVAGALHHLGVFMGSRFDEPHRNNPKGFWEDLDFKELHKRMFAGETGLHDLYSSLVRTREAECRLWGVKDPLLCLFLNTLVQHLQTDHKLIVCRRPLEEICQSMSASVGSEDPETFRRLAELYIAMMEWSLKHYTGPVLEVHKEEPMIQILEPIAEFVGVPVTQAAVDFLS